MNSKISIIVPIYNVEIYLEECIESIVNQTYKNIEIILIDDGSTDKSGEICDKYSKKDSRVKTIHQENKGIGQARNVGLQYATGEYIGWVDSDDIISNNMYEVLLKNMIKEDAQISCCNYKRTKDKLEAFCENEKGDIEVKNEKLIIDMIRGPITCFLWDKLFRRELFNDIKFTNHKVGEDFLVVTKILSENPKVVITNGCYYFYRYREGSSLNNVNIEGRRDLLKSNLLAAKILKEKNYDDEKWMNYKTLYNNLLVHNQIKKIKNNDAKQFDKSIIKNLMMLLFKLPRNMNKDEKKNVLYAIAVILKIK